MKVFIIFGLLFACAVARPSDDSNEEDDGLSDRVKFGKIAKEAYPFLVSLKMGGENLCGGSLIHPQWILSAAHCMIRVKNKEATEVNINNKSLFKGYRARVEKHIPHKKYNPERDLSHYDIGLLKLTEPVPTSAGAIIDIPTAGDDTTSYGGQIAMVLGWGRTEDAGITSMLREANLTLVDNKDCNRKSVSSHQICANIEKDAPVACHGDSGGPLIVKKDGKWLQVGVVSHGAPVVGGEHCHTYDIYTKITAYLAWIKETIDNN